MTAHAQYVPANRNSLQQKIKIWNDKKKLQHMYNKWTTKHQRETRGSATHDSSWPGHHPAIRGAAHGHHSMAHGPPSKGLRRVDAPCARTEDYKKTNLYKDLNHTKVEENKARNMLEDI